MEKSKQASSNGEKELMQPPPTENKETKVSSQSKTATAGTESQEARNSSGTNTSSSAPNTNTPSSGGTGNTVSSADTVPTQEVKATQETIPEEENEEEKLKNVWGILFPIDTSYLKLYMSEDKYIFGRSASNVDYCFDIPSVKATCNHFDQFSKRHFNITREKDESGNKNIVILQDTSLNGVFINGEKVGKGNKRHLIDKDEIGLVAANIKVFLYIDRSVEDTTMPTEFTSKYMMHKLIGSGAFGQVREVLSKKGTQRFAAKIIEKKRMSMYLSERNEKDILTEARLMINLRHPCIISVHDIINAKDALYIILELAVGGELFNRLLDRGAMKNDTAKFMFYQMLSAVAYLHDNNVTHRDLKPENILLTSNEEQCLLKITDFGMSRIIGEDSLMQTQAGTRSYLAPEIIKHMEGSGSAGYTRMVDSWSLGVILYMCIAASPPFSSERQDTKETLSQQILNGSFKFRSTVWKSADENVKDLITLLLKVDPTERTTPKQAMDHVWLNDDKMKKKVSLMMTREISLKRDFCKAEDVLLLSSLDRAKSLADQSTTTTKSTSTDSGVKLQETRNTVIVGTKRKHGPDMNNSSSSTSTNGSLSPSHPKKLKEKSGDTVLSPHEKS